MDVFFFHQINACGWVFRTLFLKFFDPK